MRRLTLTFGMLLTANLALGLLACGSEGSDGPTSGGGSGGVAVGGSGGVGTGGVGTGGVGTGGVSSGGTAGTAGAGGSISEQYPDGPYGNDVGDTIANLAWEGHVNDTADVSSDQKPFVDYGTDGMRKSGRKYGLIHLSAFT